MMMEKPVLMVEIVRKTCYKYGFTLRVNHMISEQVAFKVWNGVHVWIGLYLWFKDGGKRAQHS